MNIQNLKILISKLIEAYFRDFAVIHASKTLEANFYKQYIIVNN